MPNLILLIYVLFSYYQRRMVARVNTVSFQGIDVKPVDVQVQISNGLPAFYDCGLYQLSLNYEKISAIFIE